MVDQLWFSQQKHLNHLSFQGDDALCREIWKVCSGSLLDVPKVGERVYYFPRLHVDQLEQSSNQDLIERLHSSNLPPKILCRVLHIRLLVERETEEVYAETILLPNQDQNEPTAPDFSSFDTPSPRIQSFCKSLTPSDIKHNWGLSVPLKDAVKCFPPLDMGQEKPSQELIAKDLQGNEWRFKHAYQDFEESLERQEETIPLRQQNSSEDHSRQNSSIPEHPTSFQGMSISSNPSRIPYEGPGRGDEQVPWGGYQVARRTLPILSRVVSRYPDSLVNFRVASSILQSAYLEILAELVYFLENLTILNLSKDQFNVARQHIWDLKLSGIEIGWLENRLLHIDEVFSMESLLQRRQALTRRMEETFRQLDEELGCIDKKLHEISLKVGPNPLMRLHHVLEGLL
ncbi:unnamed protein product [Withania somnifera]